MDAMLSKSLTQSAFFRPCAIPERRPRPQRSFRSTLPPSAFKFLKDLGFEKPSWLPNFKKDKVGTPFSSWLS